MTFLATNLGRVETSARSFYEVGAVPAFWHRADHGNGRAPLLSL